MEITQSLENLAGGSVQQTTQRVTGGLMKALDEHPGGLSGVLDHFRNNGMEDQVKNWASGQQQSTSPDQIEKGLGNSGLIDKVAQHAGVSSQTVTSVLARVMPMVISHFTRDGQQSAPQSGFGGMAAEILRKVA